MVGEWPAGRFAALLSVNLTDISSKRAQRQKSCDQIVGWLITWADWYSAAFLCLMRFRQMVSVSLLLFRSVAPPHLQLQWRKNPSFSSSSKTLLGCVMFWCCPPVHRKEDKRKFITTGTLNEIVLNLYTFTAHSSIGVIACYLLRGYWGHDSRVRCAFLYHMHRYHRKSCELQLSGCELSQLGGCSGFHLLTGSKFRRLLCMADTVVLFNQWFICPGRIHRNLKWSGGKMLKPSVILLMGVFSVGHRGYILLCSTFVFFVVRSKGVWIYSSLHNSSYDKTKYVNLCCCVYLNCTRILATFSSKFLLIFMGCVQLGFFFFFSISTVSLPI